MDRIAASPPQFMRRHSRPAQSLVANAEMRSGRRLGAEFARLRTEIALLQAQRAALQWELRHDELTGLPNRRHFRDTAPDLLHGHATAAAVMLVDLNDFKPVNDRFGHDIGDGVLRAVAQRLLAWAGENLVARLGGDEFAGVLVSTHEPPPGQQWWRPAIAGLAAAIAEPIHLAGHRLAVTASIGVAPVRSDMDTSALLHVADRAMYEAKTNRTASASTIRGQTT